MAQDICLIEKKTVSLYPEIFIDDVSVSSILTAIREKFGHDFTGYKKTSRQRRLEKFLYDRGHKNLQEMIPDILEDRLSFQEIVDAITVNVTDMFRDPSIFSFIQNKIFPYLLSYPNVNIWSAGCATGEEAYSLAILAEESNLLKKTKIYATDISSASLENAKCGIFEESRFLARTDGYRKSGGEKHLFDYYHSKYGAVILSEKIRKSVSFFQHNMCSDRSFIDSHLIMCSNVMIYFDEDLKRKVLHLFYQSLNKNGFLVLGAKERIPEDMIGNYFEKISSELPVYRKIYR